MAVSYEWDVELVTDDEFGDIVDHLYADDYADAVRLAANQPEYHKYVVVLVRDAGNERDGLTDRQWAYVEDGKLPGRFDGGAIVPAKYKRQVSDERH